jgi:hypothetical protein
MLCADFVRILGLRMQEITKIDHARLEAKKVFCKPRVVHVELPQALLGSWYYPQCVTAKRCGGCCNSALLECKPRNITIVKKWVSTSERLHDFNNFISNEILQVK